MLVALVCRDKPGHLQTRLDTRAAHLAYIEVTAVVKMAGPLIEDGEMRGSLIVLDVADVAAAGAWAARDPYAVAGLFRSVEINEWKKAIG
ncbi:MAG: YciI family protein [Paracoccaceae bacterium]